MSFALIVYLIGMLESASDLLALAGFMCFVGVLSSVAAMVFADDEDNQELLNAGKKTLKAFVIAWLSVAALSLVIPTKETAYIMLAASGVESIVTDERVQQLGGKSLDAIEQWLDEMSPEKEGE